MLELVAFSPLVEFIAIFSIFVTALLFSTRAQMIVDVIERVLKRIASLRFISYIIVAAISLILSMMLSLTGRLPQPIAHDEFGYLLSADTFSHARLTNPAHPMWMHFETFHILHQPTYMSKYPPAQGLILAVGEMIAHPIVGVWLTTVIASIAIYWMLIAWVPPWLAFLGGILTSLHPGLLLIWGQIYWGGQVAIIGSALVFGAFRRIVRHPQIRDALLMGIGLAVLANRRPYEGAVVCVPVAIALLVWMFKGLAPKVVLKRFVIPLLLVVIPTGIWMAYYNWRVTGDPLLMPFMEYEATYTLAPVFIWQQPWPMPAYRHKAMADFYSGELAEYLEQKSISGFIDHSIRKLKVLWIFYAGIRVFRWSLIIPLIALPWLVRNRWTQFSMATLALFVISLLALTWQGAHYAPPIAGVVILLALQGSRSLRLWRFKKCPLGRFLMWSMALVAVASFAAFFAEAWLDKRTDRDPSWHFERARLNEELGRQGRHLIIVRYGPHHDPYQEWVYNKADIDASDVVWAREMDHAENMKLIEYFNERNIWLLNVGNDEWPPRLVPFISDRPH